MSYEIKEVYGRFVALGTVNINRQKSYYVTTAQKTRTDALDALFALIKPDYNTTRIEIKIA